MIGRIRNLWIFFVIAIFIILLLFPLYIMFKVSLSVPQDIFVQKPSYLIKHVTFNHFKDVIASGSSFFSPLKKSLITAFFASLLGLLIAVPAAYAISKFDYRLRYALVLIIFMKPNFFHLLPL